MQAWNRRLREVRQRSREKLELSGSYSLVSLAHRILVSFSDIGSVVFLKNAIRSQD